MEKTIGIIMIVAFFVALFYMIAKSTGWKNAVIIFLISAASTAFICFAAHLITK